MVKSFLIGATLGAIAVGVPSYNVGRGAPAFSNPLQERHLGTVVKEAAHSLTEEAKTAFKELNR